MSENYQHTKDPGKEEGLQAKKERLVASIIRLIEQANCEELSSIYHFVLHITK